MITITEIESIFDISLTSIDNLTDNQIEDFMVALNTLGSKEKIENYVDPQWVVLAGGKGSRIDPSGQLNKTLDIWFGRDNVLDLSRRHLPTTRPHIVVVNPSLHQRLVNQDDESNHSIFCVQQEANGTGGALKAALPVLQQSSAEFVGITFGDEPFLPPNIFWLTLISHFIQKADITLCAKKPLTVVDKGGLFFDRDGHFIGTKEWYDMTQKEQAQMQKWLAAGCAYTNTGITLVRREAMIERLNQLELHKNGTEYHFVDLINHFYRDGLKTNAYVYQETVLSGVNRWSNVLEGEIMQYKQNQALLTELGVRVDPQTQFTYQFKADQLPQIGVGCHFLGRVHLDADVKIGDYCRLENTSLFGRTSVGDGVSLKDVTAEDSVFLGNSTTFPISEPVFGLRCQTKVEEANLTAVQIGTQVQLKLVNANATVIPCRSVVQNRNLGVPTSPRSLWWDELVTEPYLPGVFTLGQKQHEDDWFQLRQHILMHTKNELITRSTSNHLLSKIAEQIVADFLDLKRWNGKFVISELTPEQIWGAVFEMVKLATGASDPYYYDKRQARQTAFQQLNRLSSSKLSWQQKLKLVIAGNIIDYSSARVVKKLAKNTSYFDQVLSAAIEADLSIDCFNQFKNLVIDASPKSIVWLVDNDGEVVFDLWLIEKLAEKGHHITIVGKPEAASNDATVADIEQVVEHSFFQFLPSKIHNGQVRIISSGSVTIGTNLHQATYEFANSVLDADLVISKGQGNFFTTKGLNQDVFYLLMSKGVTAEVATGIVADQSQLIDGLILAYVPAGTHYPNTLANYYDSL